MSQSCISIRLMEKETIEKILSESQEVKKKIVAGESVKESDEKVVGLLFFENSTRTRVSFEQAAAYVGYRVVNFAGTASSISKGETLKDTILTLKNELLDCVVMRHYAGGSANLAQQYFEGPIVNAGDGEHEHPTQALGDAMTILESKGKIEGLNVAIVGDVMHSRVARSNAWLLSKLGANIRFVGPRSLIPAHTQRLPGEVHYDLRTGIQDCDVVMCLRMQKERMEDGRLSSITEYSKHYQVNKQTIKWAKPDAVVMHPGPLNRGVELDDPTADGKNSLILEQVRNCVYVRATVLKWINQMEERT